MHRLLYLTLILPLSAFGENLLRNPSFELDEDQDGVADHWTGSTSYLDQARPMNGSVQVTAVYLEPGEHVLKQAAKLEPGKTYTLACWIRGRAAKGNAWVRYRQTEPTEQVWTSTHVPQGHSEWILYQQTFTAPEDHMAGQFEIAWRLVDQGLFRFDFASLVEGDSPPDPPNTPPRLRVDQFDVAVDTVFGVGGPGVLENDDDADDDEFEVVDFTQAKHGKIAVYPDGAMTYDPKPGFRGDDQFTYRVRDARNAESFATVRLRVGDLPKITSMLAEGSFEAESGAWDVSRASNFTRQSEVTRSGEFALRLEPNDSAQFARQDDLPFRSDKRYRLTAWVKGKNLAGGDMLLQFVRGDGRRHWHTPKMTGTFDWRPISVEFGWKHDPVTDGGGIDILTSFKSGTAWIDDVVVEEFNLPYRVFIDGYSVTGGVVPILRELGRDAVVKGITDREILIYRSPPGDKEIIRNNYHPLDSALICTWSAQPGDKYAAGELARITEWRDWFAGLDPAPKFTLFHWQPWGLQFWPEGFEQLEQDYRGIAREVGIPLAPCTLAFHKIVQQADDPQAALRKLYSPDYHHAGREGNYLKALCVFIAITGKSPVGLTQQLPIDIDFGWPPETLTEAEALEYQQAAWDAWVEANEGID